MFEGRLMVILHTENYWQWIRFVGAIWKYNRNHFFGQPCTPVQFSSQSHNVQTKSKIRKLWLQNAKVISLVTFKSQNSWVMLQLQKKSLPGLTAIIVTIFRTT